MKKEIIAMILAGGQGKRLKSLTQKLAKPAVPFGGKYRIIDFVLSNLSNSNIDTVGILTQYQPYLLNEHIGIGIPWNLNRRYGGVSVLQPYESSRGAKWYLGTANAVLENLDYIRSYNPEYVLIVSGDHIYKMNYAKMLKYHIEKEADCTISVIKVPIEEASRFGILDSDKKGRITSFEEKPKEPKTNKASMGIYIFNTKLLVKYLEDDAEEQQTEHDFGKNIITKMLSDGRKLYAYEFEGYWKDVGTVQSLWESNLDLLDRENMLDIYDNTWRIYTKNEDLPPQYIAKTAEVKNSMINEGCKIYGKVIDSVIFTGVTVEEGAEVTKSVIFPNSVIKKDSKVSYALVMDNQVVESGQIVSGESEKDISLFSATKAPISL